MRITLARRISLVAAVIGAVICIILLLNFTAENPTGRRYSSETPIITGGGNSAQIGTSGERILSSDLGVQRNEQADQRQCVCNMAPTRANPPLTECRVCMGYAQLTTSFRRPDFITNSYIAESKNATGLAYSGREVDQIGDYVISARALGVPLWVYVRVNSTIDPEFSNMVNSTGGGVVRYFTVPGYVDATDQRARTGLIIAVITILILGLWELLGGLGGPAGVPMPTGPDAGKHTGTSDDLIERARRKNDRLDAEMDQQSD